MTAIVLADGTVAAGTAVQWPGGWGSWEVYSSSWSGSVKVQKRGFEDTSVWIDVDATNLAATANKHAYFDLPACVVRLLVTGGPPTALRSAMSRTGV